MQIELLTFTPEPLTNEEQALFARSKANCANLLAAERPVLEDVIEIEKSGFYRKLNYSHLTPFLVKEFGLSSTIAGYLVTVARKSIEVPQLAEAIQNGELSVSTAAHFTSVVTKENVGEWAQKAKVLPKRKLEEEVANHSPRKRKKATARRIDANTHEITIHLNNEQMEKLRRAQDLESQRRGESVDLADVVAESTDQYLHRNDPIRKAERAKPKPEKTYPVYKNGKRTPIPAALDCAVKLRDQGQCQTIGPDGTKCCATRFVQTHHIIEVAHGGQHEIDNLITVCGFHHRQIHRSFAASRSVIGVENQRPNV